MAEQSPSTQTPPPVPRWRAWLRSVVETQTLGQLVRRQGLVSDQQLAQAIAIQRLSGERLGHVLIRLDYVEAQVLDRILSRQRAARWLNKILG